jgi:hypothetical protein
VLIKAGIRGQETIHCPEDFGGDIQEAVMAINTEDKRRFPRIQEQTTMLVRTLGKGGVEGFCKGGVLGLGGCEFSSETEIAKGTTIELLIAVESRVVRVGAKVVTQRRGSESGYIVGVKFTSVRKRDWEMLESLFALEGLDDKTQGKSAVNKKTAVA